MRECPKHSGQDCTCKDLAKGKEGSLIYKGSLIVVIVTIKKKGHHTKMTGVPVDEGYHNELL